MNPNENQAIQDEQAGIEEEGEDIDYDALYGGLDLDIAQEPKSPELKNSYSKIFKDVAKQGAKETLIGLGGTWGDLAELAGLNKSNDTKTQQEFSQLDVLEKGGKLTQNELQDLGEDTEVPREFRLPTSENLRGVNEAIGGPGEAETPQGKYAGRAGKIYGSGLAFGQVNPVPAVAAGVAGQGVEDLGGGPLAQAATEIATLLLTQGRSGKNLVSSAKKEVQDKITKLRTLGYTEEDITLAINSASKGKKGGVSASKGASTEQAFENFAEHSNDMVSDILTAEIPGIERGIGNVHQMASDAYGQVAREASNITIANSTPFLRASQNVVNELQKNLGRNPEAQSFIQRISEAAIHSTQYPTAESFMNFYKELNGMGNWLGRSQKDRLITQVKDGIKETFRSEGKQGRELAQKFEEVNTGIRKAYRAEEVHDLVQKTATQDGIDFNKLNKVFDKQDNVHLFEEVLGTKQSQNLNTIAKTGKEIKDFDKAWKVVNQSDHSMLGAYYLFKGDWAGLAKMTGSKILGSGAKKLAEKSLTDPKFQNLLIRGLHAIQKGSVKSFSSVNSSMKKYLDDEGIEINLD